MRDQHGNLEPAAHAHPELALKGHRHPAKTAWSMIFWCLFLTMRACADRDDIETLEKRVATCEAATELP